MNSPSSWVPARHPCRSTVQHYPALCWASQSKGSTQQSPPWTCQFPSHQSKQPFLSKPCKEQGLSTKLSANGSFLAEQMGWTGRTPQYQWLVASFSCVPCVSKEQVEWKTFFSFHFLSLTPAIYFDEGGMCLCLPVESENFLPKQFPKNFFLPSAIYFLFG